ncbi:putative ABC-type dipeptide transport system,periplasmic component [Vibrio nigripulchritudo SFn27]|uniref:ABC-type dipeptide transport system,periplasmic component n=2 Tax=Vibrio nigripulchritudo TaxID=28173 RepID=A0AAV2VR83_9VIBR|nr:ABC transporter substrate-binding protein [Vibrio nigripulchritudo]CCN84705.1 putative ABC-type dipeptide transport system,periplasmic component [Vibrio nigripulchritudo BLFn1]CCN87803.1 putative ABC-type dipeptide transport system,periplasmic component [Vibrio nigripulchritudo SFn27]CCN95702.1 putative ABC-type dipeptide transport system,periplasmic component [Vibrio nigripulchritudo ENn2]CCO38857.1 putative ABC-type dipeptide transport system,periplasmic component [Vibrio nigripulchritudo 
MLANIKKTALAVAVVAAATSVAPVVSAAERSELTIHPKEFTTFVRNFNPFLGATHLHTTWDFLYEPLVVFNEMHGNTPVMRLASDYKMSDDLMSVTFDIRKGVKWSDGEKFTADDVVFSFDLVKNTPALDQHGTNNWVANVEKIDEYKVRFRLTEANSNVPYEIAKVSIVPEHVWSKVEDPTTFMNENPVGSGPFTEIATFTPQLYVQCRNPNYWDNDNLDVDCLRVPQIANNDQFLGKVVNSEMDWTSSFIPDIDRTYAAASPKHHYWYPPAGTQAFVVNFKHPDAAKNEALNNVDFRRAFSMALDRQTIIDIAFYGGGTVNDFASGLGYAFEAWSDEKTHNKYKGYNTYNVEGAKELLKKAGFKDVNKDGFVDTPSGKSFELLIQSPNGWTDFNNTVQLAVEQLEEVGIKARARTPDFSVYNQAMLEGTYDVAYTNYFHGADPYTYWNSAYNSSLQDGAGMPRFAMHFFKDSKLDSLLDSFYKTADKNEQLEIAHGIQQIIASNQVTVPVMSGAYMYQYNTTRFTGWWSEKNPKGRPNIWAGIPERLLHVLDLKPVK